MPRDSHIKHLDEITASWRDIVATQEGIAQFCEGAAQVLAEAARASEKAIGDSPTYAAKRWSDVILRRAQDLLAEDSRTHHADKNQKKIEHYRLPSSDR